MLAGQRVHDPLPHVPTLGRRGVEIEPGTLVGGKVEWRLGVEGLHREEGGPKYARFLFEPENFGDRNVRVLAKRPHQAELHAHVVFREGCVPPGRAAQHGVEAALAARLTPADVEELCVARLAGTGLAQLRKTEITCLRHARGNPGHQFFPHIGGHGRAPL